MAVVIDGTTGVNLIQDGVVQTADLASTLDLSGKTVTYGLTDGDMPSGSVIQVVQGGNSTQISSSDSTEFDIATVNITPLSTSSRFFITGIVMGAQRGSNGGARLMVRLRRNSDALTSSDANFYTQNTQELRHGGYTINTIDSAHNTTSQITYKLVGSWSDDSNPSYVNKDGNAGTSTITVMEIV